MPPPEELRRDHAGIVGEVYRDERKAARALLDALYASDEDGFTFGKACRSLAARANRGMRAAGAPASARASRCRVRKLCRRRRTNARLDLRASACRRVSPQRGARVRRRFHRASPCVRRASPSCDRASRSSPRSSSPRSSFLAAITTSVASSPIFLAMRRCHPQRAVLCSCPRAGFRAGRRWCSRARASLRRSARRWAPPPLRERDNFAKTRRRAGMTGRTIGNHAIRAAHRYRSRSRSPPRAACCPTSRPCSRAPRANGCRARSTLSRRFFSSASRLAYASVRTRPCAHRRSPPARVRRRST